MTLAEHAEAWAKEQNIPFPPDRNSADWKAMYAMWHAWAFKGW